MVYQEITNHVPPFRDSSSIPYVPGLPLEPPLMGQFGNVLHEKIFNNLSFLSELPLPIRVTIAAILKKNWMLGSGKQPLIDKVSIQDRLCHYFDALTGDSSDRSLVPYFVSSLPEIDKFKESRYYTQQAEASFNPIDRAVSINEQQMATHNRVVDLNRQLIIQTFNEQYGDLDVRQRTYLLTHVLRYAQAEISWVLLDAEQLTPRRQDSANCIVMNIARDYGIIPLFLAKDKNLDRNNPEISPFDNTPLYFLFYVPPRPRRK